MLVTRTLCYWGLDFHCVSTRVSHHCSYIEVLKHHNQKHLIWLNKKEEEDFWDTLVDLLGVVAISLYKFEYWIQTNPFTSNIPEIWKSISWCLHQTGPKTCTVLVIYVGLCCVCIHRCTTSHPSGTEESSLTCPKEGSPAWYVTMVTTNILSPQHPRGRELYCDFHWNWLDFDLFLLHWKGLKRLENVTALNIKMS